MKRTQFNRIVSAGLLGFAALASPAYAQTSSAAIEAASMDDIAGTIGGTRVQQHISEDFSAFAGSESNARSLVTGAANVDIHGRGVVSAGGADAGVKAHGSVRMGGGAAGVYGAPPLTAIGHTANPGLARGLLR